MAKPKGNVVVIGTLIIQKLIKQIGVPSQFAAFVACEIGRQIFEIGCGDGRDSFFFSTLDLKLLASTKVQRL